MMKFYTRTLLETTVWYLIQSSFQNENDHFGVREGVAGCDAVGMVRVCSKVVDIERMTKIHIQNFLIFRFRGKVGEVGKDRAAGHCRGRQV